jgi:hypothetical protein
MHPELNLNVGKYVCGHCRILVKNVGSNEPRTDFNSYILKIKFWDNKYRNVSNVGVVASSHASVASQCRTTVVQELLEHLFFSVSLPTMFIIAVVASLASTEVSSCHRFDK